MTSVDADFSLVDAESRAVANATDHGAEVARESGVALGDGENGNDEVDDEICSPIVLECGACGASQCVFDARTHGYSGEITPNDNVEVTDDTGELFLDEGDVLRWSVAGLDADAATTAGIVEQQWGLTLQDVVVAP